ncbi:hypothetical protein K7432_014782 [Basidiobolus ranarum]|uniref:Uncharacterized protein n=1 Tax=Basidiobolus ranarum TaxID=34480 RepID=A0ABR2VNZ0_9FUNG
MKFSTGLTAVALAIVATTAEAGYVVTKNHKGDSYLWTCPGNPVPTLQGLCAQNASTCTFKAPMSFTCTSLTTCNILSGTMIGQNCQPKKV